MTCLPDSIPPVKSTLRTSGLSSSAAPTSEAGPETTLITPGGRASAISLIVWTVASGDDDDGLITTVLPAMSAWGSFAPRIESGQFQGMISAATPIGRLVTMLRSG